MGVVESAEEIAARLALESATHGLNELLAARLPPDVGFAILLFNSGGVGSLACRSTVDRASTIVLLRSWLRRLEGELS